METEDGRHWKKVKDEVSNEKDGKGGEFEINDELILDVIYELNMFDHKDNLEEITYQAKEENKTEGDLEKIKKMWNYCEFKCIPYKNTDISTLKMDEDDFGKLEEDQQLINTMSVSKYIGHYEKEVNDWKFSLGTVYDVVQILGQVQITWSFLENLFIQSQEVQKELPNETEMFKEIDKDMKNIMKDGVDTKILVKFCTKEVNQQLEKIQEDLKVCEKALNEFLDKKRKKFPRFYFVSVNDLLDILSNGSQPQKINKHMSKIFQGIQQIEMDEGSGKRPTAKAMESGVGIEYVEFTGTPLVLENKVEEYLQDVIDKMISTLTDIGQECLKDDRSPAQKKSWIEKYPSQLLLLINNVDYVVSVEESLNKTQQGNLQAMGDYLEICKDNLRNLIIMVQDNELAQQKRQKIMCLITMDTHSRDVVAKLIDEGVKKSDEFQWQSQLKFYSVDGNIQIKIADAILKYTYEYLGNGPRLVITPLTDRIYVTATQALHLKMGCAPAGPAGTGKTETTKDLANALAKAIYVFNCSSEMNYESMGNIYKGLASSGCWGCFDEFNRLLPEVLSVCSVQFKAVTDAIKEGAERFVLQGDEISCDPTCGVFITMNPGYLGRAELPEGLKALFRPITVVVPDLELISENMLFAEGFEDGKALAKKFITLYTLCKDLLSKQAHYDWGLRAIKSVLVVAGSFKRADLNDSEESIMLRALRDFNLPKLPVNDLPIFYGLLGDLFPKLNPPRKRDLEFEKIMEQTAIESGLFPEEKFIEKVVQLQELLEIRHCVFVMGPPGSGKTRCWQTLKDAFSKKESMKVNVLDINPKVVSTRDFYGYTLPSKDWKDGLFSNKMRFLSNIEDKARKWLILDGDLDANWIESMNSVMDDNKILTLANNERIPCKPLMRILFEIRDLKYATPATVSRAGILYISDEEGHQYRSYYKSWIKQQKYDDNTSNQLTKFFEKFSGLTLDYLKKQVKYLVPIQQISQIVSVCKALQTLITKDVKHLEYIFIYAFVWSVGGCLTEKDGIDYKKEFSNWWKNSVKVTTIKFPPKGSIFEYYVDKNADSPSFQPWSKIVEDSKVEFLPPMTMGNTTVPTMETVATSEFIRKYSLIAHPCLLIGNAGCGKTQLTKGVLKQLSQFDKNLTNQFVFQTITFNYYTDSVSLQNMLESQLDKVSGKRYGPKVQKTKLIYFIDDLNMQQVDLYNTQNAIALLRQLQDYGHWYDISKLDDKIIQDTQVIGSMNPFAGSFYVNPRYQRHFWTCAISFPGMESLSIIYQTFLAGHLTPFKPVILEQAGIPIVKAVVQLHLKVQESFKKTAINFHYEFNLRHISNIFQGLLLSKESKYQNPEQLIKLFIHESERTYGDRLVNSQHVTKFKEILYDIIKKTFPRYNWSKLSSGQDQLIFVDFPNEEGERIYNYITEDRKKTFLAESLNEYNSLNAQMNLVLFEDAMNHICRICRIVLPSSGHALLVGVGGSGKQSLTALGTFIMNYTLFSIVISATYDINDLKNDFIKLYTKCGTKDEQIVFLFTEGQITKERFLVYINDLLCSGEIADLYVPDDKDQIVNTMRSRVKAQGIPDTKDNVWAYFIDQIKKNLHMVICFSPVGDMRRRARQFPGLVNCTTIDWFFDWPYEALLNVSTNFLSECDLGQEAQHKAIVEFIPKSFKIVNQLSKKLLEEERRYVYTTPKSFLELIKLFKSMLLKKKKQLDESKENYEIGLEKLKETEEKVAVIEVEVKQAQSEAQIKKEEADIIAEEVGKQKAVADVENEAAKIEQDKCEKIQTEVSIKKKQTEEDLEKAGPLVEQAQKALQGLKKEDFQTAKSFAQPPGGVGDIFSATIYILAGQPDAKEWIEVDKNNKPKSVDWKSAKLLMKEPEKLKSVLMAFQAKVDANEVFHNNFKTVREQYLTLEHFTVAIQKGKSTASAGLCDWVINICKYYEVIQDVEPKRKALKESITMLNEANEKLEIVMEKVRVLNEKQAKLQAEFDSALKTKNDAESMAARCARRLDLATRLVSALKSEKVRWADSIVKLQSELELYVGDVLMASAFVSYAGPFNKKFRESMIKDYFIKEYGTTISSSIDIQNPVAIKMLIDDSKIAKWNQQKLPADEVSVQNGVILTNSERYSLMIDPQLQGIKWIYQKEKENNLKSLRLGSKAINSTLESCIKQGFSGIIENMEEKIDAIYMPLISRSFIIKGRRKLVKFAGKDQELHENFFLILHTKLSNPHYPPEIQAETTLINFTVTEQGLADQLLSLVVQRERPDLAEKRIQLINEQNDFKITLMELEESLLRKLIEQKGDILDDIELIESLERSKELSIEISGKVEIAKITEAQINETSSKYYPTAVRGALFFFLLADISKIHSFYKYSLESYLNVVHRSIDQISDRKKFGNTNMTPFTQEGAQQDQSAQQKEEVQEDIQEKQQEQKPAEEKPAEKVQKEEEPQVEQNKEEGAVEGEQKKEEGEDGEKNKDKEDGDKKEEDQENASEKKEEVAKEEELKVDTDSKKEGTQNTIVAELSNKSLAKRVVQLTDQLTMTSFQYTMKGLFEKHKLIVSTMLTLRISQRAELLLEEEVNHLIIGGKTEGLQISPVPDQLKSFITEQIWGQCIALQNLKGGKFEGLSQSLEGSVILWNKWYKEQAPELASLPGQFNELSSFHKLLLLRAMRPDRVTQALYLYVAQELGQEYVERPPFDIVQTFSETTHTIPMFFVLFPGVDPTPEVERIGRIFDVSRANNRFTNISMGQGQEQPARDALFSAQKKGHWVMLQNVHLMQNWLVGLQGLEGFLETIFNDPSTNPNFRIFISSEPPGMPDQNIIPESILQSSIKVSNEAPQNIKANMLRAYNHFDDVFLNKSKKVTEFKACIFGLCWFHSVMLGRKKFGSLGWSRVYNFNDGDLTICADVLYNYLEKYEQVPWDDLRYIFGDIMYGGHITDEWDRRTNSTYLKEIIKPEILSTSHNFIPSVSGIQPFKAPDANKYDYNGYIQYIKEKLPVETPYMFHMHPNAEIGYLTQDSQTLFNTFLDISGGGSGGGSSGGDILPVIDSYLSRLHKGFDMLQLDEKIKEKGAITPYQVVLVQECDRMNGLLKVILDSLEDLKQGTLGTLNMTDTMEELATAININKVPANWTAAAYHSKKNLSNWFQDNIERCKQLDAWKDSMECPKCLCISYLFNPMSFLTAIIQDSARKTEQSLANMTIKTVITSMKTEEDVTTPAESGAYIHGMFLEGASWESSQGADGYLIDQKPKELHPKLPVMNVVACTLEEKKNLQNQYTCPVYVTSMRGPTYIFPANLNIEEDENVTANKWVLTGTCLIMSDD